MAFVTTNPVAYLSLSDGNISLPVKDYTPELNQIIETLASLKVEIGNIEDLPAGEVDLSPLVEEFGKLRLQIDEYSNEAKALARNTNQSLLQINNLAAGIGQSVSDLSRTVKDIQENQLEKLTQGQATEIEKLSEILTTLRAEQEFFKAEFDQIRELQKSGNTSLANIDSKLTKKEVNLIRKEETIDLNEAPLVVIVPEKYSGAEYSIVYSGEAPSKELTLDYTVEVNGKVKPYYNDSQFEQPLFPADSTSIALYGQATFNFSKPQNKIIKITALYREEYAQDLIIQKQSELEELLIPEIPDFDMEPNRPVDG